MKAIKFLIIIISAMGFSGCRNNCGEPAFFDRVADTTLHNMIFNADSITCKNDTTTLNFNDYKPTGKLIVPNIAADPFLHGKLSLTSDGLAITNRYNTKPQILLPFKHIGYINSIEYKICAPPEDTFCITYHPVIKVTDLFFDKQYNDTIYQITRIEDTLMGGDMFEYDRVYFIGKHVGLVGYVFPFKEPHDKDSAGRYLLYGYQGNIYPEKYKYSLVRGNFL